MNINQAFFYVGTSTIEPSCRLPTKTVTRQLCYSTLHHYALFLRPEVILAAQDEGIGTAFLSGCSSCSWTSMFIV